jgi:hypothetical protein
MLDHLVPVLWNKERERAAAFVVNLRALKVKLSTSRRKTAGAGGDEGQEDALRGPLLVGRPWNSRPGSRSLEERENTAPT